MNDAEYAEQKARVQKLADKWLEALGLRYCHITQVFERVEHTIEDEGGKWQEFARCKTQWQYLYATLTWCLVAIQDLSDEDLERVIIHECMHIFLNETREEDGDLKHEEHVASMLTNAVWWVHTTMDRGQMKK